MKGNGKTRKALNQANTEQEMIDILQDFQKEATAAKATQEA